MKRVGAVVAAGLLVVACSSGDDDAAEPDPGSTVESGGAEWAQFGHDLANSRLNTHEADVTAETVGDLTESWSVEDVVGVTGNPTIADGIAYFGDWTGMVRAVEADTGDEVWTTEVGGSVNGSVPVAGDAVFAASGRTLRRLDRATGEVEWEAETNPHPFGDDLGVARGGRRLGLPGCRERRAHRAPARLHVPRLDRGLRRRDRRGGLAARHHARRRDRRGRGRDLVDAGGRHRSRASSTSARATPTRSRAPSWPTASLAIDYHTGEVVWSTQFTNPDVFSAGNPQGLGRRRGCGPQPVDVGRPGPRGRGRQDRRLPRPRPRDRRRRVGDRADAGQLLRGRHRLGRVRRRAPHRRRRTSGIPRTTPRPTSPRSSPSTRRTATILWEVRGAARDRSTRPVSTVPGVAFVGTDHRGAASPSTPPTGTSCGPSRHRIRWAPARPSSTGTCCGATASPSSRARERVG